MALPKLTKHNIDDLRYRLSNSTYIHAPEGMHWWSHGYEYVFFYDSYLVGWIIRAGCRRWRSFKDMRSHYNPAWRTYEDDDIYDAPSRKQFREEALVIHRQMKAVAKAIGLKLVHAYEDTPPKKKTRRPNARPAPRGRSGALRRQKRKPPTKRKARR